MVNVGRLLIPVLSPVERVSQPGPLRAPSTRFFHHDLEIRCLVRYFLGMQSNRVEAAVVLGGLLVVATGCASNGPSSTAPTVGSTQAALVSYDEAMQMPVSMGDVTKNCPERQLSEEQVVAEMDRHLDTMYRECVVTEYKRGGKLDVVTIDIAILGDGSVQGATVSSGSKRFRRCVTDVVEDVRFPKFSAPRMGARYQFHTS